MSARDVERSMLERCSVAASSSYVLPATDQRDANIFRLASILLRSRFPVESQRLGAAADAYLTAHPDERVEPTELIRRRWIIGLPRLRDMLTAHLERTRHA